MDSPLNVDRYIKLITKDELSIGTIKKWYRCVMKYAPSGTVKTIGMIDEQPKQVSLLHRNDGRHNYLVPLTRDLSDEEVDKIVEEFVDLEVLDNFDVETNETKLQAGDAKGMSIDASKHLALCMALAKQKHEDWVRERTDAGWRYGTEFDAEEKTHPLLRPWDQIPDRYRQPDMEWPQKLVGTLNDQGYAIIPKDELDKLLMDLRGHETIGESYTPPTLDVGDDLLVGKFKNSKAKIKGFTTDDNNQPVLKTTKGDQKLFKPRIPKLMSESANSFETLLPISVKMATGFEKLLPHVQRKPRSERDLIYIYASTVLTMYKHPLAVPGEDACGINLSLSINENDQVRMRIIEITSNKKGMGEQMLKTALSALPAGSEISLSDWSGGFWQKMKARYTNYDWKF